MDSPLTIADGFVLALPGGFTPGGSQFKGEDGVPRRRFIKSLLKKGEWRRGSDGVVFAFGDDDLDQIAKSSRDFLANGNRITLPIGHDMTGDPGKNRGYVLDVFREDDQLWGMVEAIGEDGIKAASRSHVSIYAPPSYTDPKGNKYKYPIKHVALTTDPVITDQSDFIPIAASNGATVQAAALLANTKQPTEPVKMDLKKLAKTLGITEELTDDNAIEIIASNIAERDQSLATVTEERDGLKTELADAKKGKPKTVELSNNEIRAGKRELGVVLGNLVKLGRLTADEVKKITADPITSQPLVLACGESGEAPAIVRLFEHLGETDLASLGEKTGRQVIELANEGGDDEDEYDEKVGDRMLSMVGAGKSDK